MKMRKHILFAIVTLMLTVGLTSCDNSDNPIPNEPTHQATVSELGEEFDLLPLPIAEWFVYLDAIGYMPGSTVSKAELDGETIYMIKNPVMSSGGDVYNKEGEMMQYGTKYYKVADWKVIVSSLATEDSWEKTYPAGYKILMLAHQFINSYNRRNIQLDDLPGWAADKVRALKGNSFLNRFVLFRGIWQGQTVYYFNDEPALAPFDTVYDQDGNAIVWADNASVLDFVQNSTDWQLLYMLHRSLNIGCDGE